MSERIDRRRFLTAAAGSGLALTGCGGAARAALKSVHKPGPKTLQQAIRGRVFTPGSPGFVSAANVYNMRFDGVLPSSGVARPINAADVQNAVKFLVANDIPFRTRSGGHSYAGYSTLSHGAVLDLRKLNGISVNKHAGTATIGPGAQLIDVYAGLAAHGATIPAGSCPSVGLGGHALGGGMGLAGRNLGLALDNIVGIQVVTADGKLRNVSGHSDPDLFWGLRGAGGGNFGVVTAITFKVHAMPATAASFFVNWPWSSASEAIDAWQNWAPHAPNALSSVFHIDGGGGSTSVSVTGQYFGPAANLGGLLSSLAAVPGASISTGDHSYLHLQMIWAGCASISLAACHTVGAASGGTLERASFNAKSDYVATPLSAAARQVLISAAEARGSQPGSGAILFDSYGGAINQVHPNATAFVHRNELFCIQYLTYGGGTGWLSSTWSQMRPYVSGQAYQNYIDQSQPHWQSAYYGSNYSRLKTLRKSVDPDHRFNFPQAIGR